MAEIRQYAKGIELTAQEVKAWEPDPNDAIIVKDGSRNLWLRISPRGKKVWRYLGKVKGCKVNAGLGEWPGVSLADARKQHDAMSAEINRGEYVPPVLRVEEASAEVVTARKAYAAYMDSPGVRENAPRVQKDKWAVWLKWMEPRIGDKPIKDVTRLDCANIINDHYNSLRAKGRDGVGANRTHAYVVAFFNWCISSPIGLALTDLSHHPYAKKDKVIKEDKRARSRVLSERELKWFFECLTEIVINARGRHASPDPIRFDRLLEFRLRTAVRIGSILKITWGMEKDGGFKLPGSITKKAVEHWFYLTPRLRELIGVRPNDADDDTPVFPVSYKGVWEAEVRLREATAKRGAREGVTVAHWQGHDFRHTAKTVLEEHYDLGEETTERFIMHVFGSTMSRRYNHARYGRKLTNAMNAWNDYLDDIAARAETLQQAA